MKTEKVFGAERNFDGIGDEAERKVVDQKYNNLHDELSDCYYNFWKKGLSKPFKGHDVQDTPEKSKELFDSLHALIFHKRDVELDSEKGKNNKVRDTAGTNESKRIINEMKVKGIEI